MDYFAIGAEYNSTPYQKKVLAAGIAELEWETPAPGKTYPVSQGMAIVKLIEEFKIPKVSAIAINGVLYNRYGLLGIEANYKNGARRLFFLDRGSDLVPLGAVKVGQFG